MPPHDYYEVLGVPRSASQEEIRAAFRRLAREHHPDARQDDPAAEERFKDINEAFQVLSDPEKRRQYDRFGRVATAPSGDPFGFGSTFDDLLDTFFGARRARVQEADGPARGADLRVDVAVSLEDAARGVEREISIERLETCPSCFGTGAERGSAPEMCPACRGRGQVRYSQRTVLGSLTQIATCPQCGGSGRIIRKPCAQCRGHGQVELSRTLTVSIPAGVDDGMRLRLAGEGEAGVRGGGRGDLYVFMRVEPHPVFQRRGRDLIIDLPISVYQATLGDEVTVPTILGADAALEVPAGTQHGDVLTVKGQGMPGLDGRRGDQHVRVQVRVPKKLTAEERARLLDAAKAGGHDVKPRTGKKILDKMKDLLQ